MIARGSAEPSSSIGDVASDRCGPPVLRRCMEPYSVNLPLDLMNDLRSKAASEGTTADELAAEAVRRMLEHCALDSLIERGRTYAARVGRCDPVKAVRDVRSGR